MEIGDKIKMEGERTRYTIQAFDDRFVIATKPHFKTYLYCLIDLKELVRGGVNRIFGMGCDVDTPEGAREALSEIEASNKRSDGDMWGVSLRSGLELKPSEIAQLVLKG